jgi:hypothetical protein
MSDTTIDPATLAVWHGMDVCGDLVREFAGVPILIKSLDVKCSPLAPVLGGRELIDLVVTSDGAWVIAYRLGASRVGDRMFVAFPENPMLILGPVFRADLRLALTFVVEGLPAQDWPVGT